MGLYHAMFTSWGLHQASKLLWSWKKAGGISSKVALGVFALKSSEGGVLPFLNMSQIPCYQPWSGAKQALRTATKSNSPQLWAKTGLSGQHL